jgi:hypothetical protein
MHKSSIRIIMITSCKLLVGRILWMVSVPWTILQSQQAKKSKGWTARKFQQTELQTSDSLP